MGIGKCKQKKQGIKLMVTEHKTSRLSGKKPNLLQRSLRRFDLSGTEEADHLERNLGQPRNKQERVKKIIK